MQNKKLRPEDKMHPRTMHGGLFSPGGIVFVVLNHLRNV